MRPWIGCVLAIVCTLSSTVQADEAFVERSPVTSLEEVEAPALSTVPMAADDTTADEQALKHVGKASTDSANTARASTAAKYVLAAGAVVIGVTALILVSRHGGHHSH